LSQLFLREDYITKFHSPLKNALHFGEENMELILNSRVDNINSETPEYVVKLKNPLPDLYEVGTTCNVINIAVEPFFQKINYSQLIKKKSIRLSNPNFSAMVDDKIYLNKSSKYYTQTELSSSYTDEINNDISVTKNISQFNVNYADFSEFIVFSSAHLRVKIFENKIIKLAILEDDILSLSKSGSLPATFTQLDGYNNTIDLNVYSNSVNQKNEIVQSFDYYESYLYNEYLNGTFSYDIDSKTFVESGSSTPSSYISDLEISALEYDKKNKDSLINNTPDFIYSNSDNDEYIKFLGMIGHHFDNIYLYISNFNVYKEVGETINEGVSRGLLNSILNSFGFKIPPSLSGNVDEENITDTYLNNENVSGSYGISLDDKTKTVWKRILNNLPAIYKSKGTEESIRHILSCYGIPRNFIQIKEFGGGYDRPNINSWNNVYKHIYLLEYVGAADEYVKISGSGIVSSIKSVDFKFSANGSDYRDNSIIQLFSKYDSSGNQTFSLGLLKDSVTSGRVYVYFKQGAVTYSYKTDSINLFSDEITGILLRRNDIDENFKDVTNVGVIPTKYDISICKRSNELTSDGFTYSFYVSSSLNTIFDINDYNVFGNITSSVVLVGVNFNVNNLISGYSAQTFKGVLDRFSYNLNPISDDVFYTKNKNLYSYYDGMPSASYLNAIYSFDLGYPIDISVSSSGANGFLVYNDNTNYGYITASLHNFTGSNVIEVFNTSSCVSESLQIFPYQTRQFNSVIKYDVSYVGPSRLENVKINRLYETRYQNMLFPKSSVTNKTADSYYEDANKLGIFLAPTDERNTDILDFYGNYNIISSVGNPDDRYSSGFHYSSFNTLRDNFYNHSRKQNVLFNELFTMYRIYVDKSVFETLKNILPSRNKIYSGLLIEPTILERNKIPNIPPTIENINIPNGVINLKNIVNHERGGEFIEYIYADVDVIKYQYDDSYVENNFYKFASLNDVPDDFQLGTYIEANNSIAEVKGIYYKVYVVDYSAKLHYMEGRDSIGTRKKLAKKLQLVESSSAFNNIPPTNYSLYTNNYYNNLTYKPLRFRKESQANFFTNISLATSPSWNVKSRETELTTINDQRTISRKPILSIGVGGVINTGTVGTLSNSGVTNTNTGGTSTISGGGTAGSGGNTGTTSGTGGTSSTVGSKVTPTILR
jgi:hypothetical protein